MPSACGIPQHIFARSRNERFLLASKPATTSSKPDSEELGLFPERILRSIGFLLFLSARFWKSPHSHCVYTTVANGGKRPSCCQSLCFERRECLIVRGGFMDSLVATKREEWNLEKTVGQDTTRVERSESRSEGRGSTKHPQRRNMSASFGSSICGRKLRKPPKHPMSGVDSCDGGLSCL